MKELIAVDSDSAARKYIEMLDDNDIAYEVHTKTVGNVIRPQSVGIFVNEKDYPEALKLIED